MLLLVDAKSFWKHSLARRTLEGQDRKAPTCQVGKPRPGRALGLLRWWEQGLWERSLGLGPRLRQAPAVWPWGFVPSWCPHPWKMRLGTSPAEIIAGHTLPREAQKVLNRGFLPPPWGCQQFGAGWGQDLIPRVPGWGVCTSSGISASLRLALQYPTRSAEGVLRKERCWVQ